MSHLQFDLQQFLYFPCLITHLNKNGLPEGIDWPNYQTYLLANRDPNGDYREASELPLASNVAPIKEEGDTNRDRIYFYMEDTSMYQKPIEEIEVDSQEVIVKGYVFDGEKVNKLANDGMINKLIELVEHKASLLESKRQT